MDLKKYIATQTDCKLYLAEAKQISTFRGGGKAWVFEPESTEKLIEIVHALSAEKINLCGEAAVVGNVIYLPTDLKKRERYKRSIELSKEYGLYRQSFCGCEFSQGIKENCTL